MSKHQANAPSNGWIFEYAAALFLFLQYSQITQEIGVEKDDDIIIKKADGHYIVAQAKSSLENDDIYSKSHHQAIKNSFRTLSDTGIDDAVVDEYITINNFRNPFGEDSAVNFEKDEYKKYPIKSFSKTVTEKLEAFCESDNVNLDLNKVHYWFVSFQGEPPYSVIKKVLEAKMANLGERAFSLSENIYLKLYSAFQLNSRQKRIFLEKDYLLGAVFGCLLTGYINVEKLSNILGMELELGEYDLDSSISKFFNERSMSLAIYSEIITHFLTYCDINHLFAKQNEALSAFINNYNEGVPEYFSSFFANSEHDVLRMYKFFMAFVCQKNILIDRIKEAFAI